MLSKAKYYGHLLIMVPLVLAGLWFYILEITVTDPVYLMHARLDDVIPFTPLFVVPYAIWYVYAYTPAAYMFFKAPREFTRYAVFLSSGMALACAVYTLFPNGQDLRPALAAEGGPLIDLIRLLYAVDTPANSAPSLHVIYSVGAHAAITHYNNLRGHAAWINAASLVLAALCVLSTVFIKQHSVIDLITGLLASVPLCILIYGPGRSRDGLISRSTAKRTRLPDEP